MKNVEGKVRKACEMYDLIEDGDRITVGVSGGKDSVALLAALTKISSYSLKRFSLSVAIVDAQFNSQATDYTAVEEFCQQNNIPIAIRRSNLAEVVFDKRNEKNPCSLCARMRRGILHDMTLEAGCSKIALGHHMDDAVETLFLNLIHQGRMESLKPKTYLSRKNITMIRPLILCGESEIQSYVMSLNFPIIKSQCPKDGYSEREEIKNFVKQQEKQYKGFTKNVFCAMQRGNICGFGYE
ncbi:MAG: tRNA lysidine(34) synthetase TilS [Oscillospiraceae bacterium]|nr:tRNA lysidine(34) synthetase TilS [Oscillospiraceae bacterium]